MQRLLQKMLLIALFLMPWVTMAQSNNFTCDFESDADTAAWDYANGTATNKWYISNATDNGGDRCLYISKSNGSTYQYQNNTTSKVYAYRTLTLAEGNYEYSFDWQCKGESSFDYLRVALAPGSTNLMAGNAMGITTTELPAGWIALDGGSRLNGVDEWQTRQGTVDVSSPGEYKLVFYWCNDGSGGANPPAAIDNISLVLPTCSAPTNLAINNIKSDSATFTWQSDADITAWYVTCLPAGTQPGEDLASFEYVTENTYSFGLLAANTPYNAFVRSACGDADLSSWRSIPFTTACGDMVLPFRESFESVQSGSAPTCWNVFAGDATIDMNSSWESHTEHGSKFLAMGEGAIVASSYIPYPCNTLAIDFSLQYDDYEAGSMQVCFATDLEHIDAATVLATITPEDGLINIYEVECDYVDITTGGYLVFKQVEQASSYSNFYLDNIFIRQLSDCRRPASLTATRVRHNRATLRWTEVEGAASYEVVYGTVNDVESTTNTRVNDVVDDSLAITNLTPETDYYMWVRNACGDENSEWRAGGSFTTQISCAQVVNVVPTSVGPNGIALAWKYNDAVGAPATQTEVGWKLASSDEDFTTVITDNKYYIIQDLNVNTAYNIRLRTICDQDTAEAYLETIPTKLNGIVVSNNEENYQNYIPTDCYRDYSMSQMIYPASDLTGLDTIREIAFRMHSSLEMDRTWDIYMGNTPRTAINAESYVPMDSLTLVGSAVTIHLGSGWCSVALTTPFAYHSDSNLVLFVDDNTGAYRRGIEFYTHTGSGIYARKDGTDLLPTALPAFTPTNSIPDIAFIVPVQENACMAPLLTLGDATTSSVDLIWNQGNEGETWQVEYRLPIEEEWTVSENAQTDTTYTVSGLNAGSFYLFRVGTHCGDAIQYSAEVTGFTSCDAINVPYVEDFSGSAINPCWIVDNANGGDAPRLSNEALYSNFTAGGYFILPEINDDIASLQALFSIKCSRENAEVVIAVGTNPEDASSFVAIDTFTVGTTVNDYVPQHCSFSNYVGEGHYIAFYFRSEYIYIDDLNLDFEPDCTIPSDLTVSGILSDNANLSWSGSSNTTTGWMITYKPQANTDFDTITTESAESEYTLTELTPNTKYEVWIYNICGTDTIRSLEPLIFKTECANISLPYSESFETVDVDTYHSCWHTTNFHTYGDVYDERVAPQVLIDTDPNHGKVLRFGDNVNMITPLIMAEANRIRVTFDAKVDDNLYSGQIAVGFTLNPNDISDAVYVDTISFDNLRWNTFNVSFESLTSTDEGYVVFRNINNQLEISDWYDEYYDGYIDNVVIMEDNGCPVVTDFSVSNVTPNGATLTFTDNSNTGSYTINYSTTNDPNIVENSVDCTDSPYDLVGLEPGTRYYVWVRNNCAQGGSMWSDVQCFTTTCNALNTIPYEEDFDSYTVDVQPSITTPVTYPHQIMPTCWSFLNMSQSSEGYPRAFMVKSTSLTYADSATCLIMVSSKVHPLYSILPAFTTPIDSLKVSFTYRNLGVSAANGTLALGVITDPSDSTTFTVVAEYPQTDVRRAVTHTFSLDELPANDNYRIAFRYTGGTDNKMYLGIDNVLVERAEECITPEMFTLNSVTDAAATLSWNGSASSYNVQYRESTISAWTDAPSTSTNSTTLTGLSAITTYKVRVQANCGTSLSEWTEPIEFTTSCGLMSIPYSEDFNSYTHDIATGTYKPANYPNHQMPSCWSFPVMERYTTPTVFLSSSSAYAASGNCLFFTSDANKALYAILPGMNAELNTLSISFMYRNENTYVENPNVVLGVMTNPDDLNTFVELETFPISSAKTNAEHSFTTDEELVSGTTYYIAFRYGGNGSGYYMSLDNIVVDIAPSCIRPTLPVVDHITSSTANVAWTGTASKFECAYKDHSVATWTSVETLTPSIVLSNLSSTTQYDLKVRAICGVGDTSDWSASTSFTTACAPYDLPYTQDFSMGISNSDIPCVDRYSGLLSAVQAGTAPLTPGGGWQFSASYPINNGSYNANLNIFGASVDSWLVTPSLKITDNATLQFDMARRDWNQVWGDDDKFIVLVTSDNGATWTTLESWIGTQIQNIPLYTESYQHKSIALNQFVGDTIRIAFYGESTDYNGDHYVFIDNIDVDFVTSATCDTPTDLLANNVTHNSVTLTWHGTANNYDVDYRANGSPAWISHSLTANSYSFTGLNPETTYEWRVRANCGDLVSDWDTSTFTTLEVPTSCDVPTALTAQNVTSTSATLTWQGTANEYDIEYHPAGIIGWLSATINTNSYSLTDLMPNSSFEWRVRSVCGDVTSDWATSTFTTTDVVVTCEAPTALTAEDITENTASLSWQGTASSYEMAYRASGTTDWTSQTLSETSYSLTALQPATLYEWKVRAICGETNSEWTLSSFTTAEATIICEAPTALTAEDITENAASLSWQGTASSYELAYRASDATDWTSQTLSETSYSLTALQPATLYEWKVRAICGETNSEWATSTFTTAEATILCEAPTALTATASYSEVTLDWTAPEGQSSWEIAITAEGIEPIEEEVDEHPVTLDDDLEAGVLYTVKVRAICGENSYSEWSTPATFSLAQCEAVTNVKVTEITTNTAKVSWSAVEGQSQWEIKYGEKDFDLSQGESIRTSVVNHLLTELAENTYYDVYVRAICDDDITSEWSQKVTFQTMKNQEGIDGVEGDYQFAIYPNPASGSTTISLQGVAGKVTISVVDMNGRSVMSETLNCNADCEKRIDIAHLSQGTYFVRMLGDNINSVRKLIVK